MEADGESLISCTRDLNLILEATYGNICFRKMTQATERRMELGLRASSFV